MDNLITQPLTASGSLSTDSRRVEDRAEIVEKNAERRVTKIFGSWSIQRHKVRAEQGGDKSQKPQSCARESGDPCAPIQRYDGPEQIVHFRQPVIIDEPTVAIGDPVEGQGPFLQFACVPVAFTGLTAALAIDLRYEQHWYFRRQVIGALSATVALAPGETVFLSIRNTQRKRFDRETVDEVERSEQNESTIADKDVLNVTRSTSKTNNWNVSGNASVSIGGFGLGASGSVSESVTDAANSSAQRTSESTQKSASNLKTLQKVQVRESIEITTENAATRKIQNPLRDRSLRLDVYETAKVFCVDFHLVELIPVLILTLDSLHFNRLFVLNNGSFIAQELLDRRLALELAEALQMTSDPEFEGAEARAEDTALLALSYLFDKETMFGLPLKSDLNPQVDPNQPSSSFEIPTKSTAVANGIFPSIGDSALGDAISQKLGIIFTTLAFYYKLYREEIATKPSANRRLALQLALSLDRTLAPKWIGIDETTQMSNVLDEDDLTEIFRRLGGFLTFTSGVLHPLLEPAESERELRRSAERAKSVISRVINHLRCHSAYYTERYLVYMSDRTRMQAASQFVKEVLAEGLPGVPAHVCSEFDPDMSFLDGRRIVTPVRIGSRLDELSDLFHALDGRRKPVKLGLIATQEVIVPTDGVHIEPNAGQCVLTGVSVEPVAGPIHVAVNPR